MLSRDELLEQVLALGPDDRAVVVGAVQESLHHQAFAHPDIAVAWAAEIDRRADAVERGEMPTEYWRTVIARLQNRAPNSRPN